MHARPKRKKTQAQEKTKGKNTKQVQEQGDLAANALPTVMHQMEIGLKRHIPSEETRLTEKEPSNPESKLCNHQQFNSRHGYHIYNKFHL